MRLSSHPSGAVAGRDFFLTGRAGKSGQASLLAIAGGRATHPQPAIRRQLYLADLGGEITLALRVRFQSVRRTHRGLWVREAGSQSYRLRVAGVLCAVAGDPTGWYKPNLPRNKILVFLRVSAGTEQIPPSPPTQDRRCRSGERSLPNLRSPVFTHGYRARRSERLRYDDSVPAAPLR